MYRINKDPGRAPNHQGSPSDALCSDIEVALEEGALLD